MLSNVAYGVVPLRLSFAPFQILSKFMACKAIDSNFLIKNKVLYEINTGDHNWLPMHTESPDLKKTTMAYYFLSKNCSNNYPTNAKDESIISILV